ncbi:MAG: hypothetical protein KJ621_08895 [Proteobacteria bacterium]|nr:hypothetical protein [Pseudomonadota bacterium]MBU1740945.1 hypothetical protein [Pseudomonadota bacterium]
MNRMVGSGVALGLLASGIFFAHPALAAGADRTGGDPSVVDQLNRRIDRRLNRENRRYLDLRRRLDRLHRQRDQQRRLIDRHLQDLRQRHQDRKRYLYRR